MLWSAESRDAGRDETQIEPCMGSSGSGISCPAVVQRNKGSCV